jgi:hypothetical protein
MYGREICVAEVIYVIWTECFKSENFDWIFMEFGMNIVEVGAWAVMSSEHFRGSFELVRKKL